MILLLTSFWENFLLLLIFLPLVAIWSFALVDIFQRRDMGGWSKALWVLCVLCLPFLGTFVYLVMRPRDPGATAGAYAVDGGYAAYASPSSEAAELGVLADLHDRGKLTDVEFAKEKARIIA
jgi:hypothetical protein